MGILNVTPDSFAERRPLDREAAVETALQMEEQGADIIDIGGESTRPGADAVSAAEELARVMPVLSTLAGRVHVPVSVDTYKAEVARAVLAEGAEIINDISGLRYDPALAGIVASRRAALVLTHNRGRSKTMYAESDYSDVVADIVQELGQSVKMALNDGISQECLILDPGIGFAKRPLHSYVVLARLSELTAALERPVLVGPSRKSFMQEALKNQRPPDRDWGTAAAVTAAVLAGAHIVRVHAVREMAEVVRVAEEIRRAALRGFGPDSGGLGADRGLA